MKFLSRSSLLLASGLVAASVFGMAGEVKAEDSTVSVTITDSCAFATAPSTGLTDSQGTPSAASMSGTFKIRCNMTNFSLVAKSSSNQTNPGLVGTVNTTTYTIPYNLIVTPTNAADFTGTATDGVEIAKTDTEVASRTGFSASCAVAAGCQGDFTVDVDPDGVAAVPAGTYSDTIVWTLTGTN